MSRRSINEILNYSKVSLSWVPGHRDIVGNCIVDEIARAVLAVSDALQGTGVRIATIRLRIVLFFKWSLSLVGSSRIRAEFLDSAGMLTIDIENCLLFRIEWPSVALLLLSRVIVNNVGMRKDPSNDYCRSCKSEEKEINCVSSLFSSKKEKGFWPRDRFNTWPLPPT